MNEERADTQFILNVGPEESESALRCVLANRHLFSARDRRPGWGWTFYADNGRRYFVRDTVRGMSISPTKTA